MPKKQTCMERVHPRIGGAGAAGKGGWETRRAVWRAGLAVIAISLGPLSADADSGDRKPHVAQAAIDAPSRPAPVTGAPTSVPANSPEQIRRAQTELRRLDCLQGRIDGKFGGHTREAVKKFWAMAKQPEASVDITNELISNLVGRGDNFCRPPRRFIGFGGRAVPPMFAPGARPGFVPPTVVQPPSPDPGSGRQ
jgi:peptidoglycan hydrolase-like protein with peptidoglycan-binding domain